jgi:hypothetical protein
VTHDGDEHVAVAMQRAAARADIFRRLGLLAGDSERDLALARLLRSAAALNAGPPEHFLDELSRVVDETLAGDPVAFELRQRIAWLAFVAAAAAAFGAAARADALGLDDFAEGLRDLERDVEAALERRN